MIKRGIILSLLVIFISISTIYANADINESGFRDLKWKDDLQNFPEIYKDMILLDFDKNKKVKNYVRKNSSYSIYDNGFYPIYYQFWYDKFISVRAEFDSEKDTESFQNIYNKLVEKFGVPKKFESQKTNMEVSHWQTEDTGINLNYNANSKRGYLYIYSKTLQKEYFEFLKNEPDIIYSYKNQPGGFEKLFWGQTREDIQNQHGDNVIFKPNLKKDRLGEFIIQDDNDNFLGVPIISKTYEFFKEKFFCVYIYYKSDDNKETFEQIYKKLLEEYDEPSNGRYDKNENIQYYVWAGEKTYIIMYYFFNKKESYIFFVSKPLYDEKNIK